MAYWSPLPGPREALDAHVHHTGEIIICLQNFTQDVFLVIEVTGELEHLRPHRLARSVQILDDLALLERTITLWREVLEHLREKLDVCANFLHLAADIR